METDTRFYENYRGFILTVRWTAGLQWTAHINVTQDTPTTPELLDRLMSESDMFHERYVALLPPGSDLDWVDVYDFDSQIGDVNISNGVIGLDLSTPVIRQERTMLSCFEQLKALIDG